VASALRLVHTLGERFDVKRCGHRFGPWPGAALEATDRERNRYRPTTTTRHGERWLRWTVTSPNPASSIQARISDGLKLRLWLEA
jgi:hypothetical protein